VTADERDELLQEAIDTGRVPATAVPDERAELESLLRTADRLQAAASAARDEADRSMPTARARFQRHLAAQAPRAALPARAAVRDGFFERLWKGHRALAMSGAAAVVGVLAAVALFVSQDAFSGTETASALVPGDYVQVEGVVTGSTAGGDGQVVQLQSEAGTIDVSTSPSTEVVDGEGAPAQVNPGDRLVVSGTVQKNRSIAAQTLARSARTDAAAMAVKPRLLKRLEARLEAKVLLFAVAEDGRGRVLVAAADGRHYVVPVDAASLRRLLESPSPAVGSDVAVEASPSERGTFALELAGARASPPGSLTKIRGVVTSREGNFLRVASGRGPVTVVLRPATRIIVAETPLTAAAVARGNGDVRGYVIAATGVLRGDRLTADVLVVVPRVR
jgi:hypothetical protein